MARKLLTGLVCSAIGLSVMVGLYPFFMLLTVVTHFDATPTAEWNESGIRLIQIFGAGSGLMGFIYGFRNPKEVEANFQAKTPGAAKAQKIVLVCLLVAAITAAVCLKIANS